MPGSAPESPCCHLAARAVGESSRELVSGTRAQFGFIVCLLLVFLTVDKFRVTGDQRSHRRIRSPGTDDNNTIEHVPVSVKVPVHM